MPITFADKNTDEVVFEYYQRIPSKSVNLKIKGDQHAYRVNITALTMYTFYKNSVYRSYSNKRGELAADIKSRTKEYQEPDNSIFKAASFFQDPLYHYSIAASLDAMQEWKDKQGMQCYIAYHTEDSNKKPVGFVHFIEKIVNNKVVVYIAQAGVSPHFFGMSIGRQLMECVLSSYQEGTEFIILTRVFNTEAVNLYQHRLGFQPISEMDIQELGYDQRYCGFRHITASQQIDEINGRKLKFLPAKRREEEKHKALSGIQPRTSCS